MAMTRKDFRALATTLNNALQQAENREAAVTVRTVIRDIASYCAVSNGGFNQPLFFTACGLTASGQLPADDGVTLADLKGVSR
jgi:hypothetical protein